VRPGTWLLVSLVVALVAACDDVPPQTPCQNIPAGGCPNTTTDVCQDPTCESIYDCVNGDWVYDSTCPVQEGGPGDDGGPPDAFEEPAAPRDAAGIDAPPGSGGGPGCPDLQSPDCSLDTAIACPSGECCDCEDLFYCQNGGWQPWGACVDGGLVPIGGP
jgi:hypothetical protein